MIRLSLLVLLLAAGPVLAGNKAAGGVACKWSSDCLSGNCKFGKCAGAGGSTKGSSGVACKWSSECESGNCKFGKCAGSGGSTKGAAGVGCKWSSDCASGNCAFGTCKGDAKESSSGGRTTAPAVQEEEAPVVAEEAPMPEPTPCSKDLLATVLKEKADNKTYQRHASAYCAKYTPEQLAIGKEIHALGYEANFARVMKTVAEAKPEELECVKKEFAAMPKEKWAVTAFEVRSTCKTVVETSPCALDLMATVYKDKTDLKLWTDYAERDCKKNAPELISEAKAMFLKGYGRAFSHFMREVGKAKGNPAQLECAKTEWDARTPSQKTDREFDVGKACKNVK